MPSPSPAVPAPRLASRAADTAARDEAVHAVRTLARLSRLLERSSGELTLAQYRVLSAIAEGEERASRVARRLALGKPTVSALVEALCQHGLLERAAVAGDQRVAALALTPRGEEVLARVEHEMVATLASLTTQMRSGPALLTALAELGSAIDQLVLERQGRP